MKAVQSFYLVSLGCAKNTVISSAMAEALRRRNLRQVDAPRKADYLIVNTCGFIAPAREESLSVLRELGLHKKRSQRLLAVGCLSQRYAHLISQEVPGVDGILGTRNWMDIVQVIDRLRNEPVDRPYIHDALINAELEGIHHVAIQGASAYVKIADGCRRQCAYCAIPLIKGSLVSRPPDAILSDLKYLEANHVQEAILIAQDTTDYGHDLRMKDGITPLLRRILHETNIPWLRLLYTFPGFVSDDLIELMASENRLLPYIDIPLQHGDVDTLRRMQRPADLDWVYRTIDKLRTNVEPLALRSTFIVGYPGETANAFQNLLTFIERIQFDRVGAFAYSFEPGTPAEPLGDPIPEDVKQARLAELMALQAGISLKRNQTWVGRTLDCLIEGCDSGISVGRSFRDAPEIDGYVIIKGQLPVGQIAQVRITGAMTHDLTGVPA